MKMKILKKAFFKDATDGYMALRLAYSKKYKYLLGIEFVSGEEYEFCPTKEKALSLFRKWKQSIVEHPKEVEPDNTWGDFKPAPMPKGMDFEWPPVSKWSTYTESTL
jgi:hypothetical protein